MIVHELNMQELQHPSEHLTDNYKKDKESNNWKLLDLSYQEQKEIMRNLRLIEVWRDMDNAEGFTLDKIGKNVLELREGREDKPYRKAIKIKIRGNLSAGTIEDLNILAYALFEENFITVSETWHLSQYDYEPAGLVLYVTHNSTLQRLFLHYRDVLQETAAGGVGLYLVVLIGPFRFITKNRLHFDDLNMHMGVWNITRPRGIRWNGVINWDGEYNWETLSHHRIKMPYFHASGHRTQNLNNSQTKNFTIELRTSYRQPGLRGALVKPMYWNGGTKFDGVGTWNGVHSKEEL